MLKDQIDSLKHGVMKHDNAIKALRSQLLGERPALITEHVTRLIAELDALLQALQSVLHCSGPDRIRCEECCCRMREALARAEAP